MRCCGCVLFFKVSRRFSLSCCLLYLKFFKICAMIHLFNLPLYIFLWEEFIWWTFSCNYLYPAVLSSLLHLITPCPQYSVLQTPTTLFNERAAAFSTKNFFAGIRDLKTISINSTLAELGMVSMTAVEIKEKLEREFEIYLTPQEIRNLTFASLNKLSGGNQCTEVNNPQLEGTHIILF